MKYTFSLYFLTLVMVSFSVQAQQKINTIAGNGSGGFAGDGHSAVAATLYGPLGVAVDNSGNVFIEDYFNNRVRRISAATGIITTIAGNGGQGYTGDNSYGASAQISPSGIAVDKKGNVFITDGSRGVIRKVNTLGIITTFAGTGSYGYSGDSGSATVATMNRCLGLAFDASGNLYVADAGNHVIRKIDTSGMITTVAGDDTAGYTGDGGAATLAKLDSPVAVATDNRGNLYITDFNNNVIRVVNDTGAIFTYAGDNALPAGWGGDNGPATAARLNYAQGIATDQYSNLYIADANNNVIRKVDTFGTITTVIGNGTAGFGGDLGYVLGANLFNPYGLAVDSKNHIFIADANNNRIRETYSPTEGINNVTQNVSIEVHPNPFSSQLNVTGLNISDRVCVYDVAGRPASDMFTATENGTNTFNIDGLASGAYLLQVWGADGGEKATIKLVKE
jgi:sugar lactone lactonase YvrE